MLAQVYGGLNRENPRTRAATAATAGQILTFQLAPIEAYFHASCEGNTETGLDALGRDLPYLQSVTCECRPGPYHPVEDATSTAGALERAFGGGRGELRVAARTATGRVRRLELGGRSLSGVEFRQRLGYDRVRSLGLRRLARRPGGCPPHRPWARARRRPLPVGREGDGRARQDYRAILAHFYPGTELQTLY